MKLITTVALLAISTASLAQVRFDQVAYNGTGCLEGTVSTVAVPDGSAISFLFDEFRLEVPNYEATSQRPTVPEGRRRRAHTNVPHINQKSCNLSFDAQIPQGFKADTLEISYQARGATVFDPGIQGLFSTILLGYEGLSRSANPTPVIQKSWNSSGRAVDDSWAESNVRVVQLRSGCSMGSAKAIRFQLRNHMTAEIINQDLSKRGLITVDSADVAGMLKFVVRVSRCGSPHLGPSLPPRRIKMAPDTF